MSAENVTTESIQDRWAREREEKRKQYADLYAGVAEHLEGWTVHDRGAEFDERLRLVSAIDGQAIELYIDRGKVRVSGYWPRNGANGETVSPHQVYVNNGRDRLSAPEINVSLARGAEAIAREISRRFLPEYLRVWGLCAEKLEATNNYHARKLANWLKIAESGYVLNPRTPSADRIANEDPRGDIRFAGRKGEYNYDKGYGDVRMTGEDSIEIHLRSLPTETALRVLAAINGEVRS